jgi:hypothetical protein
VAAARRRLSAQVLPAASQAVALAESLIAQLQGALRPAALQPLLAEGGWGSPALLNAVGPAGAGDASVAGVLASETEAHSVEVERAASLLDQTRDAFVRLCDDLDEVAPPAGIPAGPPGEGRLALRFLSAEEEERVDAALARGGDPGEVLAEYDNVPVSTCPLNLFDFGHTAHIPSSVDAADLTVLVDSPSPFRYWHLPADCSPSTTIAGES